MLEKCFSLHESVWLVKQPLRIGQLDQAGDLFSFFCSHRGVAIPLTKLFSVWAWQMFFRLADKRVELWKHTHMSFRRLPLSLHLQLFFYVSLKCWLYYGGQGKQKHSTPVSVQGNAIFSANSSFFLFWTQKQRVDVKNDGAIPFFSSKV